MSRTVLIVDDNMINRQILRAMLEDDYNVVEAENGERALEKMHLAKGEVSAVLLDIVMPVMDGLEMLKRLRDDELLCGVPVIVTTGDGGGVEVEALSLGAADFVTKPYNHEVILRRLWNAISLRETARLVNTIQRDELTGLYNRESFFLKVEETMAGCRPGDYIMAAFDVDNFKVINDQFGNKKGDEVLRHIADTFRRGFEPEGGICCRVTADNFAVLYPAAMDGTRIAEIRRAAVTLKDSTYPMTFCIGRYIIDDLSLSASAMYDRATIAQATIKARFDTKIAVYDESMREHILREQEIVNEMDSALQNGQFEVWLQPQYNHATGALIGSEALVRWRHPQKGLVPPDSFIPIFERNGFIYEMDKYVWERCCATIRSWLDRGIEALPVSVNVSRYDIFRTDFFEVLTALVQRYGIPTELLRLEITETAFTNAAERIIDIVGRLVRFGFIVEIDDFGNGYSSLHTLKDVPADILKLDMRFLESNGNSRRGGNVLESVVRMANWLGMSVIAEGVETVAQADFLRSIGCFYIQGYLYARPMPVPEYEQLAAADLREDKLTRLETVEALDNNAFWDPASMDTLIFNSYVGGACIFEYCDGKIELLRVNKKYAFELFGENASLETAFSVKLEDFMDEAGRKLLEDSILLCSETGGEESCELCLYGLPGNGDGHVHIRLTTRVIAKAEKRSLIYCTIINTTVRQEIEAQLRFLNDTAHDLLSQSDSDSGVIKTLERLREYFDGDRAYIFEFNHDKGIAANTYEVCAENVVSEKDNLSAVPIAAMGFWFESFDKREYITIDNVGLLDGSRRTEREILEAQGITSLVAVPLRRDGVLIGLIGIDDPRRNRPHVDHLRAIGDYIASMLARRDLVARISSDNVMLQTLMNDTPGGFGRLEVLSESSARMIYCNDGLCKLLDMTREEVMSLFGERVSAGVHPDDVDALLEAYREMAENGGLFHARYRLRHGKEGYIGVMVFGRLVTTGTGARYLNSYYTDMTAEHELQTKREELLENLPCGAGIYEITGGSIRATYLNKRYRNYLKREINDLSQAPVLEVVHPDDVGRLKEALHMALVEGREGSCEVRIMDGKGGYIPFRLVGNVMERSETRNTIYVTYTPISNDELTIREMLPIVLEAMMASSTDLSFVKDKNLRYICCSRAFARMVGRDNEKEIVGKSDFDIFERAMAQSYVNDDMSMMESGKPLVDSIELIPSEDGRLRYASTSKFLLYDLAGNIIGLYGVGRDVTEARETDSQLKLLTDSIPGGLATFEYSPDGIRLTYFNDGFCDLFGYTRQEYERLSSFDPIGRVFKEDLPELKRQLHIMIKDGVAVKCTYRIQVNGGGYKWISHRGSASGRSADKVTVNAALFDVTEQQEANERLRISEEENRLAIQHSGSIIGRFSVAERISTLVPEVASAHMIPEIIRDVPEGPVRSGLLAKGSEEAYTAFYNGIIEGKKNGTAVFQQRFSGEWRWTEAHYSTIFSGDGKPVSAVVSFIDVTDQLEKEAVYKKWQQSRKDMDPESYMLIRCNVSKDSPIEFVEGSLLSLGNGEMSLNFDERTQEYARRYVCVEDRDRYAAFLNSDALLAGYHRGKRSQVLEYREQLEEDNVRWLRLTIDLVEYPGSTDVEAYLMYENIDNVKRSELLTIERAETDPLTGVMNRVTFASQIEDIIVSTKPGMLHAMLMLDIDGFKMVNDVFGHGAGDQVLIDIADSLRSCLRSGDLLCRLGGDEFIVLLRDIPSDVVAANKARQICALVRKTFNMEVQISGSIGVAICPRDGRSFDSLYRKVDAALYYVKGSGKDDFAFYSDDMDEGKPLKLKGRSGVVAPPRSRRKRRMLIVDDSKVDQLVLSNMFGSEFIIEKASDGNSALLRLKHYGSAISVVLLDLIMPGMDGFAVLERIQSSEELRSIPVIVVSGEDDRQVGLKAIRSGAADYVTKPVDPELLRIRVQSAISKAENEHLRAQNSFLQMRSAEIARYRTALEKSGTAVIEYDWIKDLFIYEPGIETRIAGVFDERKLWHILMSDMVAEVSTVKEMQELVFDIARDRTCTEGGLTVKLRTPSKEIHSFRFGVYKQNDELHTPAKLVFTLNDCGRDSPEREERE